MHGVNQVKNNKVTHDSQQRQTGAQVQEKRHHAEPATLQETCGHSPELKKYILPTFQREMYKWCSENLVVQ